MNCDCGRPAAEGMSVCPACFQTALDLRTPPIDWHLTLMQCMGLGFGIGFILWALFG